MMYDAERAAQMAARFIRLEGDKISRLKLMKLMYLAEKEHLRQCGTPICGGRLASREHGPVIEEPFFSSYPNNKKERDPWHTYIQADEQHHLKLTDKAKNDRFGRLSRRIENIIQKLYEQHKGKDQFQVRDYTHTLPEWKTPPEGMNRTPILYRELFTQWGYDADDLCQRIEERKALDRIYSASF